MSFEDEIQALTGIPAGHNAFYILAVPRRDPVAPAEKKVYKQMTKTQKAASAFMTVAERKAWREELAAKAQAEAAPKKKSRGTRPTRSKAAQAAHERQVAAKREAKLARSKNFGTSPKAKTRISAT